LWATLLPQDCTCFSSIFGVDQQPDSTQPQAGPQAAGIVSRDDGLNVRCCQGALRYFSVNPI